MPRNAPDGKLWIPMSGVALVKLGPRISVRTAALDWDFGNWRREFLALL